MVAFKPGFNAAEVDTDGMGALPAGTYLVSVDDSAMKDTKDNKGQYLEFTYIILEGDQKGKRIWDRMNLINDNATSVEIAEKSLAQLCKACKKPNAKDSDELRGCTFTVVYGPQKKNPEYSEVKDRLEAGAKPATQSTASGSSDAKKPSWA